MNKKNIIIISIMIFIIILVCVLSNSNKTYATSDKLKDIVINLNNGSSWSSGASGVYNTKYTKTDGTIIGNDYRYIGINVNNYVTFNNDMYRIIGVFDENSHGVENKQLVKLIRARILDSFSWGIYGTTLTSGTYGGRTNDWTGNAHSSPVNLNILLNEYFFYKLNVSNTYGDCVNWTYYGGSNDTKTQNCSKIVGYGIKSQFRNYIEDTKWHLQGGSSNEFTKNNMYLCERGLYTGCTSGNNGQYDKITTAKIGLIYPSDYVYANSTGSKDLSIGDWTIGQKNWLYMGSEFFITPNNDENRIYFIHYMGYVFDQSGYVAYGVRPTFYLKEDVYVTGGNGSFDNPYTLDCDTCS